MSTREDLRKEAEEQRSIGSMIASNMISGGVGGVAGAVTTQVVSKLPKGKKKK